LLTEYTGAFESFDSTELSFDSAGNKPSAWNSEIAYTAQLWIKELFLLPGTNEPMKHFPPIA
jgi:hypothetical protein